MIAHIGDWLASTGPRLVDHRSRELFESLSVVDHDVAVVDRDEPFLGPSAQLFVDALPRGYDQVTPLLL